jgi:hypothetical protein
VNLHHISLAEEQQENSCARSILFKYVEIEAQSAILKFGRDKGGAESSIELGNDRVREKDTIL